MEGYLTIATIWREICKDICLEHYLFQDARTMLEENDEQIRGYCVHNPSNILQRV